MVFVLDNSFYENELTFQRCSEDVQSMKSGGADSLEDDNNTLNKKSETSKKTKQTNKGISYL